MTRILTVLFLLLSLPAVAGSFTSWTPTFGATSGTLRVDQHFSHEKAIDTVQHFQTAFSVDNKGDASGAVTVTLPRPSVWGATFACTAYNVKKSCNAEVTIGSSVMTIYLYDGTFPITANHQEIIVSGFYEIAAP